MVPFDPYYKWLAIPPEEQPPNHYRLLGLPIYEADLDVIEGAAEQRTIYMRTFQSGPNAELAERLLNEISAARICLLTPVDKVEYDRSLEARVEPEANTSSAAGRQRSPQRRAQKNGWKEPWVLATAAGVVVAILCLAWMNSGKDESPVTGNLQEKEGRQEVPNQEQLRQEELQNPVPENGEDSPATKDADLGAASREPRSKEKPVPELDPILPTVPKEKPDTDNKVAPEGQPVEGSARVDQVEDYLALHVVIAAKAKQGENYNVIVTAAELSEWKNKPGGVRVGERLGYLRKKQQSGLVPLYRSRTDGKGRYLFSTLAIPNKKKATAWREKRLGWVAPRDSARVTPSMVPVYGLTHPKTKRRRFTSDPTTRAMLVKQGWKQDRILAYLFREPAPAKAGTKKQ